MINIIEAAKQAGFKFRSDEEGAGVWFTDTTGRRWFMHIHPQLTKFADIIRRDAIPDPLSIGTAKKEYDECMEAGEEPDPIERLRAFCSFAMEPQDWLDVEKFFDDVIAERQKAIPEGYALVPVEPTMHMKISGTASMTNMFNFNAGSSDTVDHVYRAMVAAAQEGGE